MKRILGLSSIIVLVLMLLLAGCGEPEDTEAPEVEPDEEAEEEEAAVEEEEDIATEDEEVEADEDAVYFESDRYVLPETFTDFIATFKEIQYTGGEVGGEEVSVQYEHVGVEEVDGVQTDKVELSIAGEGSCTAWVDDKGDFQRVIIDGEEIPIEMAQPLAEPIKNAAMAPFHHASAIDVENVFSSSTPGYEQTIVNTETETIGDMTATVYTVEVSVGPPAVEEELSASATLRIADFGDFQAVISWEATEPQQGESKGFFRIDEFALR
ncbi:MAG: hypothetical protein ACQES4_10110 [Bacillota bacterium]